MLHLDRASLPTCTRIGHLLAVVATITVALLRYWLDPALGNDAPFVAFCFPVAVASMVGGFWPGLLATLLGIAIEQTLFADHLLNLSSTTEQVRLLIFLSMGMLVSLLGGAVCRSRRRASTVQQTLRQSEQRFRSVLENALDAAYRRDLRSDTYDYLSPVIEQVMGIGVERMRTMSVDELIARVHPDDRRHVASAVEQGMRSGHGRVEYRFKANDGQYRWLADHFMVQMDAAGGPIFRSGIVRDVTEQKQADLLRREHEQQLRIAMQAAALGAWTYTFEGNRWELSERAQWLYGLSSASAIHDAEHLQGVIFDEDAPAMWRAVARACDPRGDGHYEAEYRVHVPGGGERWLRAWGQVEFEGEGPQRRPVRMIGASRDISDARRAQAQSRLQSAALEAAANGMAITDTKGRILWANPAFSQLTGYALHELIGQNPRILKSGHQDAAFYRDMWTSIRQGRPWHGELVNRRKDDSLYTEEMTITPVHNGQGTITHFISVKQDVSARKAAEQALTAAKQSAEQANAAKDHFLAVLSHELRTPLTPVTAALALLDTDTRIPEDVRSELAMIQRNVELETRLIDDLLDLTRVSRGKITLDRRPLPLCTILEQVADICEPDLEARGIRFELDLRQRPILVEGDAARLHQVFWNILKNAIKFTPAGGRIGIRLWQESGHAIVEIADSGRGIDPALLPHIFNAFEQGSREVTRQFGGLGLGLAICKALVDLHHGTLIARSAGLGQGATFRVEFPLATAAATPLPSGRAPAAKAPSRRPGHTPLRVLLVEDHGDTARVMKRFLATRGHEVTTAGDVATALDTVRQGEFDILVSDLGLPDGSGLDIIQTLRQGGSPLPAIALSGYGQEEDLRRSRAAGFNEHLVKPVDIRRLDETIDRVVGESRSLNPDR